MSEDKTALGTIAITGYQPCRWCRKNLRPLAEFILSLSAALKMNSAEGLGVTFGNLVHRAN